MEKIEVSCTRKRLMTAQTLKWFFFGTQTSGSFVGTRGCHPPPRTPFLKKDVAPPPPLVAFFFCPHKTQGIICIWSCEGGESEAKGPFGKGRSGEEVCSAPLHLFSGAGRRCGWSGGASALARGSLLGLLGMWGAANPCISITNLGLQQPPGETFERRKEPIDSMRPEPYPMKRHTPFWH